MTGKPLDEGTDEADGEVILFRHLGDQVGPGCQPGWWWVAELYDGLPYPCGQAWVMVEPPDARDPEEDEDSELIWNVLVTDDSRRQGVATRLIRACRERWPFARLTAATSDAGRCLCLKLDGPLEPEDVFNAEAIQRFLAQGMSRDDIRALARNQDQALHDILFNLPGPPADPESRRGSGQTEDEEDEEDEEDGPGLEST